MFFDEKRNIRNSSHECVSKCSRASTFITAKLKSGIFEFQLAFRNSAVHCDSL